MASSVAQSNFIGAAPASFREPKFRPASSVLLEQRLRSTTSFGGLPSSASLRLSSNDCNGWSAGPLEAVKGMVMGIYLGTMNSAVGPYSTCSQSSAFHCFAQKLGPSVAAEERVVVLVIGGGGREHALCHALKKSPSCDAVFCAPGNAGISNAGDATCIPDLDVFESSAVISFCRNWNVGLVVVGPEAPLVAGLVNDLVKAGIPAFGPSSEASALEGSKNFMKSLCDKYGIPTAKYRTFTDASAAKQYIQEQGAPIVIKADGLAAGKGVIVAMTVEEAYEAVDSMLVKGDFGSAGCRVVVEEYLDGEEASFFALVDGENAIPLESAQDHKRVGDGDTGPNTGGMGAYSPAPVLTKKLQDLVMKSIILPTVKGMSAEGCKFVGVLYAGLMIEKKSGLPKLIEYNVRFGDPECQVLMVRLESDLAQVLLAACRGKLSEVSLNWSPGSAMVVVMASKGYPGSYEKGSVIQNLDEAENVAPSVKVFHAGTAQDSEGNFIAVGGRVLGVTAKGKDLQEARDRAYQAVEVINWLGGFYRRDIGWRALPEKQFVTKGWEAKFAALLKRSLSKTRKAERGDFRWFCLSRRGCPGCLLIRKSCSLACPLHNQLGALWWTFRIISQGLLMQILLSSGIALHMIESRNGCVTPKEPKFINYHVTLEKIDFQVFPMIKGNVSLGILMTVSNPNYGSFAYHESTTHVEYHGRIAAEAEIKDDKILAHGSLNVSMSANIYADKLATDEHFLDDYFHGVLNFTASTTLHGKVGLFNFFKMKATSYSTCEISVFVQDVRVDSLCRTRVRL
ncbi:hypothetical protein FNV43_RR07780 [Rhamnella rubrinervis]|uniref:phosphoribosylamine--glycine ligase n=1 Tax=Rhamnella rubrinervis TaxID=2594499 RepID=A0A8K0MMR4_9ROSA|nr:hypothetical protein FNV43_RR07780 [Rhamnella rubrinervis]